MILFRVRLSRKAIVGCVLAAACGRQSASQSDSLVTVIDTTADTASVPPPPAGMSATHRSLSALADSISQRLVFVPVTESVFTAAVRAKHMLVDIGRVDLDISKPPSRLAAYKEAVASRAPLKVGTRLRLRGRWGADDVEVDGYGVWNGRIVATIKAPPRVDSLAHKLDPLIAVAQRADTATPSLDTTCPRDSVDTLIDHRLDALRDSLLDVLRHGDRPPYARFRASLKEHTTRVTGCFGEARAVLVVSLVGGDYEWVRERVLLVGADGKAKPLAVRDYRFRAHELQQALDGNEDGLDEVAGRAFTERAGGTVVLRITDGKRLERMTSGFSWER